MDKKLSVAQRYDRIANVYDWFAAPMEKMGGERRRQRLLRRARGKTLEVGIGTGHNLPFYAADVRLTGIDISAKMLERSKQRAERLGMRIRLAQEDVEKLSFPDASFDTVTGSCVFCSVENPIKGLQEVRRVVKPQGQVLLVEHVRPRGKFLGWLSDLLTPLTRLFGPDINRRTEQNLQEAGLDIIEVRRDGVWREIVARVRQPV